MSVLSNGVEIELSVPTNNPATIPVPAALFAIGGNDGVPASYVDDAMTAHIIDPTPHPAYDDLPSLRLLFENGLI